MECFDVLPPPCSRSKYPRSPVDPGIWTWFVAFFARYFLTYIRYGVPYIYFLLPSLRSTYLCSAHVCALVSRERFLKSPLLSGRYLTYFAKFMNAMEIWKTLTHYDIAQENQILLNISLFRGLCMMKLSFKCFKNSNWPRLFGVFFYFEQFWIYCSECPCL